MSRKTKQLNNIIGEEHPWHTLLKKINLFNRMLISYIFGSAYKQWLEKIMFLVLCFNPEKDALDESTLNDFLALLNGIVSASTISQVRLRHQPKIDSISFVEIPRNTTIKIFGTPIDQHWVKVRVLLDDTESESYYSWHISLNLTNPYKNCI